MACGGTNIFFVPYRPTSKVKEPQTQPRAPISQQKHAAREYHRRAKLERLAKLDAEHNHLMRSTSAPVSGSQSHSSSRPLLPRHTSDPGEGEDDDHFNVFDAGTGQLDPFNACVPSGVPAYALDILDYATSKQWTVFSSSKTVVDESTIKSAVFACALGSRAAFWTVLFAGATHNAYLQGGDNAPSRNRTLRLGYKSQAIKELNHEIKSLQGAASDELLLAIITLAAHGTGEQLTPPRREEKLSILESVQNFQYYGRMHWEAIHFRAVAHLVYQKGGLHNVRMPGLANAIGLADIFFAFLDLREPAFPLLAPTSLIMSTWPQSSSPVAPSLQNMTSGFGELQELQRSTKLLQIIANARLVAIGLDAYLSERSDAPTLNRIVWARNFMTHDLLSLPRTVDHQSDESCSEQQSHEYPNSSENIFSMPNLLHNLVRTSTLAYTLLVLFPIPRVSGVHGRLSQQLMLALDDCVISELCASYPTMLLWASILGGILSEEGGLKPWFAETTRQTRATIPYLAQKNSPGRSRSTSRPRSRNHSRSHSTQAATFKRDADAAWTVVRDICFRFLWFDGPECDGAGRMFWNEVCNNMLMKKRGDD